MRSGPSREQAVQTLAELGVGAIIARSFARIFYRNALNLGVPALVRANLKQRAATSWRCARSRAASSTTAPAANSRAKRSPLS
ncbi:hypothetical protein [Stenotrophomonas maltophilia]|uniref:hypothetical protein n=1 Tax=Stenotrophomonas maltophilia TaxID=40324 RepID=UPI0009B2E399|nr:hypothetical protein CEQ03_13085 [Stenotrophomonas maltophilia]